MSMFKGGTRTITSPGKGKITTPSAARTGIPDQAKLSEVARTALVQNLLTEDNLPAYHREIAMNFSMEGPWGYWVNRWTAEGEPARHLHPRLPGGDPQLRSHRARDLRMEQMTRGSRPGQNQQGDLFADNLFDSVMYVSFQELATRVSHRNTGKACNDPVAEQAAGADFQ